MEKYIITPDLPRKWHRKNYDENKLNGLSLRDRSELETDRDLDKPIEQLVCDVHEETHANRDSIANIAGAQKRMVSMMARVAKTNERATNWMVGLTVAISVMTLIVIVLAFLMWKK